MKKKNEDLLIILGGGPLFGVLVEMRFEQSPGLALSIAAGLLVMTMIVVLRRIVGEQSWPRFLAVAFTAGAMLGSALWWLVGSHNPWVFYALPGALFVLAAGVIDRLTSRRK